MVLDIFRWCVEEHEPPLASPPTSFELETQPQDQCPLFSLLPPELRIIIYRYTLTDYESSDYFYKSDDLYQHIEYRHDYRPQRNTHVQLLRTCQRIYSETWFMPFILAEQICSRPSDCGTNEDAQLEKIITLERMRTYLRILEDYANNHNPEFRIPKIEAVRYYFEPVNKIPAHQLLIYPGLVFDAKCFTFSRSYKRGWMTPKTGLYFDAEWVNASRFLRSAMRIRMELGKYSSKARFREIVSEMVSKWFFRREDGVVFRAAEEDVVYRRWAAHELPQWQWSGKLVYIIPMVTWKPVDDFDPFADGYECPNLDLTKTAK